MIIYLCIKSESNTLIFSKDMERKPFLLHMVRTGQMYVWTIVILYTVNYYRFCIVIILLAQNAMSIHIPQPWHYKGYYMLFQ